MPEWISSRADKTDGWTKQLLNQLSKPFLGLALRIAAYRTSLSFIFISGLIVLSLLPVILVASATYIRARNLVYNQFVQQLQNFLKNEAEKLSQASETNQKYLDDLAAQKQIRTLINGYLQASESFRLEPLIALIQDYIKKTPQPHESTINSVVMLNAEGKVIASSNLDWLGMDLRAKSIFLKLVGQKDTYTVLSPNPQFQNKWVTYSSLPIIDDTGKAQATLITVASPVAPELFLKSANQLFSDANAYYLTFDDGLIGIDSTSNTLSQIIMQAGYVERVKALYQNNLKEGHAQLVNPGGLAVLAYARWLPDQNLGLVIEVPQSTVYQYSETFVPFALLILAVCLIFILVLVFFTSRTIIDPILQLSRSTRNFARGDWSERSAIHRTDEIGVLAATFNQMGEQISDLYRSLESKVEERARQLRTASEVGQLAISAGNQIEILERAVKLVIDHFGYTYASIFLSVPNTDSVVLQAAYSQSGEIKEQKGLSVSLNSDSLIGWVARNHHTRIIADLSTKEFPAFDILLASSKSEIAIPIAIGSQLLGILEVQSIELEGFDTENITILQTLANQIANGLQNIHALEAAQVNQGEYDLLYRTSREISFTENVKDMFQVVCDALAKTPYVSGIFTVENNFLEIIAINDPLSSPPDSNIQGTKLPLNNIVTNLELNPVVIINDLGELTNNDILTYFCHRGCISVAIFGINDGERLSNVIVLGSREPAPINEVAIQPFLSMVQVIHSTLQRFQILSRLQERIKTLQTLNRISQAISTETNLMVLYQTLHAQIRETFGADISFLIAVFNQDQDIIEIPYVYEGEQLISIPPFPMGEGLTSYVIRTRQPLLINRDTERRIQEFGAKIVGQPAKSWMGVPLLLGIQPIGVMIVQDIEHEERFSENDLNLLASLAPQVAVTIRNVELLDKLRKQAEEFQIVTEISRDITVSQETTQLLRNAVDLISNRFGFYHASIFLLDPSGESAILQESTGDVGAEMKARAHRLGKGSRSIVGQVVLHKKTWVVNDVQKEELYYPNPLLPETRSELTIPLITGEVLLGVLDVQSHQTHAFSENEIKILGIMADQLAIALRNSILFSQNQYTLHQHRQLHQITIAASASKSIDDAFQATARILLSAPSIQSVRLFRSRNGIYQASVTAGLMGVSSNTGLVEPGEGAAGRALAERRPILVSNRTDQANSQSEQVHFQSELAVPIFYGDRITGILEVANSETDAFSETDQEFLASVGNTLGVIIANNQLIGEIRQQMDHQRQLFEITSRIRRSTNVQTILEVSAREIAQSLGANRAHIELNIGRDTPTANTTETISGSIGQKNGKNNGKEGAG